MKKAVVTVLITLVIVSGILFSHYAGRRSGVFVKTYTVQETGIISSVTSSGKIEAVTKKELFVEVPAKVQEVNVKEGDRVSKGNPLIELDLKDLELQMEQEKIKVELEKLHLEKMLKNPSPGGRFEDEENGIPYGIQDVWKQQGLSAAHQADGLIAQQKQVELAQLRVNELGDKIRQQSKVLTSPIDGVITGLSVAKGNVTSVMKPVITISDLDQLQVKAGIGEYYISKIKEGQRVEITGDAFEGTAYSGVVTHIAPVAKQIASGQHKETIIEVIIDIINENRKLKPGYSASVKVITDRKDKALIVPYEAIVQDEDNNDMVYVYQKGRAHKRKVVVGTELALETEILKGVQKGERVILNPDENLENGTKVKIRKDSE